MKNMKKLVSLLLAVCLMASLAIGASAAEPTTVDVSGGTGHTSDYVSSAADWSTDPSSCISYSVAQAPGEGL